MPLNLQDVIWQNPERLSGAVCFNHTRVPVETLFDYLEAGDSLNEFLDDFPGVSKEQATSALFFGKGKLLQINEQSH